MFLPTKFSRFFLFLNFFTLYSASVLYNEFSIKSANLGKPNLLNINTDANNNAAGFAVFLPAIS